MSTTSRPAPFDDDITRALAKDRLGVPAVVFFVMSAAAPLTYVAGVVTTGLAQTELIGLPFAFAVVGVVMALFSVGYVAMGRHLPHAGAFYAYISHGLGKTWGVAAAWVALLAYSGLQIGLYGAVGASAEPLLKQYTGIDLPWWVFALIAWAIVGVLGVLRVDLNGTVLSVLLVTEIAVIAIYNFSYLSHPAHGYDLSPLSPSVLTQPGAGALLALAVLGFTGFESAVVFSEESRNPRRTIPLATFTAIAVIATLYGLSSWSLVVTTGKEAVVPAAQEAMAQGSNLVFDTAGAQLGSFFGDLGNVLFLTSLLAAAISFHNTTARYVFALGRERVLSARFGGTSSSGAPRAGSLAQTVTAFVVIVVYAIFNLDPMVQLFYWWGTSGGFGAIILIAWTAVSVVVYFWRDRHGESTFQVKVLPVVAVLGTTTVLTLAVVNFSSMLGVEESHPLRWGIPALYVLVGVIGGIYGFYLKVAKPDVYQSIGMGAKSTTASILAPSDPSTGPLPGVSR